MSTSPTYDLTLSISGPEDAIEELRDLIAASPQEEPNTLDLAFSAAAIESHRTGDETVLDEVDVHATSAVTVIRHAATPSNDPTRARWHLAANSDCSAQPMNLARWFPRLHIEVLEQSMHPAPGPRRWITYYNDTRTVEYERDFSVPRATVGPRA
ncbi:MAG: hypothetical protein EON52_24990 [Actinomycetales bacterium]|nr:MAG: hypothetical protein EON52_24990 [Actinomycetales bacterium]